MSNEALKTAAMQTQQNQQTAQQAAAAPAVAPAQSAAWRNVAMNGSAKQNYKNLQAAQPLAYSNPYGQQIQDTLQGILNRQAFNYDVNADGLYQNIKDNYIKNGKIANMNTQGIAAGLTGGYGNSYAAQAGAQANQEYLTQLSNRIPELYQLAQDAYTAEGNRQLSNLAALQGMDETEYGRYQDDYQQYQTMLQDAYQKYKASQRSGSGGNKLKQLQQIYEFMGESYNSGDMEAAANTVNALVTAGFDPVLVQYAYNQAMATGKKRAADEAKENAWLTGNPNTIYSKDVEDQQAEIIGNPDKKK